LLNPPGTFASKVKVFFLLLVKILVDELTILNDGKVIKFADTEVFEFKVILMVDEFDSKLVHPAKP
tara:strand:- start:173 stop:370 length:198 start_codon:yes stop_codon:yes gene_type:complete